MVILTSGKARSQKVRGSELDLGQFLPQFGSPKKWQNYPETSKKVKPPPLRIIDCRIIDCRIIDCRIIDCSTIGKGQVLGPVNFFFFWTCVFFSVCVSVSNLGFQGFKVLKSQVGYRHQKKHKSNQLCQLYCNQLCGNQLCGNGGGFTFLLVLA